LIAGREFHTATLLTNGKVLVAGGSSSGYPKSAELYDAGVEISLPPPFEVPKSWIKAFGELLTLKFQGSPMQ